MDKDKLYYIVIRGTNSRVLTKNNVPIIFRAQWIDDFLEDIHRVSNKTQYEKFTIAEYERIFHE